MFNSTIRLRRDNDYNYKKIENTFIPADGEVCLVDVSGYGLRVKVGDGITAFKDLSFVDKTETVIRGYYIDDSFYLDSAAAQPIEGSLSALYIDSLSGKIYIFDGTNYVATVKEASADSAGIMKLYNSIGQNDDGTITQKAITEELDDKFEIAVNADEELIIFDTNIEN